MELSEDETNKKMVRFVNTVIEIFFHHTKLNGRVFHVVTT